MSTNSRRHQDTFALKSLRVAKVSEISEATAAAAVAPGQRVNFHIGNPIQDERLTQLYRRLIFGLPLTIEGQVADLLETLAVDEPIKTRLQFLAKVVGDSVAYLPSGGFSGQNPGPLADRIQHWLGSSQEEPLDYDLGLKSGHREITMVSGGRWEAIRMLFAALSKHLERRPVQIYLYQLELPQPLLEAPELRFQMLVYDENQALRELETSIRNTPEAPHFLVLGAVMSEESRRKLRRISLEAPLFFIEANDAPNYSSLGREAGLAERVLRILTTEAINPRLWPISLAFK